MLYVIKQEYWVNASQAAQAYCQRPLIREGRNDFNAKVKTRQESIPYPKPTYTVPIQ